MPAFAASLLQESISKERSKAQEVKKNTRVFICLGNPPYDRETRDLGEESGKRKGGWVRYGDDRPDAPPPILQDFLAHSRETGSGVHLKNLYNDYVYFWRWALWKVLDSSADAGIVTFITASSYLRGPGFGGMRRKMRKAFDELWVIDLEGDSLGARKTENVFAIRTPVAIAIGVRLSEPQPEKAARVRKVRLTGSESEKLARLDSVDRFADLDWEECSTGWDAPFFPAANGGYSTLPQVTALFPWQHSGTQFKRTWPIGVTRNVLDARWRSLLQHAPSRRHSAFKETRDRKINGHYVSLRGGVEREPSLSTLMSSDPVPPIARYAYRSFDRRFAIADTRVGDFMRPQLWRAHGQDQVYMTSLLTAVLGQGPAAMATADIPDLHHFSGRGAKDVIPLWRDAQATKPNIASGLLEKLGSEYDSPVTPQDLFGYAYGVLAQPAYVERFWNELELPPPRLPITKDAALFRCVAAHGARLIHLHTFGERFGRPGEPGSIPQGEARCTKGVSSDRYPEGWSYDPRTRVLRVGDGEFSPVAPDVWDYSVSGLQTLKSWLDYRKFKRAGRVSSPLDDIRPAQWSFTQELIELLWVLEHTLALQPNGSELLDEVMQSDLFTADELPFPTDEERRPPKSTPSNGDQFELNE